MKCVLDAPYWLRADVSDATELTASLIESYSDNNAGREKVPELCSDVIISNLTGDSSQSTTCSNNLSSLSFC